MSTVPRSEGNRLPQLLLYALGQGIGYGTDVTIFVVLTTEQLVHSPIAAHLCGKFGSAALTYFYHARFSFPGEKTNSSSASTLAYVATVGVNVVFTSLALKAALIFFPWAPLFSKVVCDVLGVVLTYVLMRTAVFPRTANQ